MPLIQGLLIEMPNGDIRCATVGHKVPATHVVHWSAQGDRTNVVQEFVCTPCAASYVRQPARQAQSWCLATGALAHLPLAVRAPEVAKLVAKLPSDGDWGSDEIGTLANWLADNGYRVNDDDLDEEA